MRLFFHTCFLIVLVFLVQAQEPGIKNYTTFDGLPSDEVYGGLLAQDGYMWFVTNNGVSKFDGDKFRNFGITDGLTENTILGISEDKNGRVWFIGISGRLSFYEKGKIHQFEANDLIIKSKETVDVPNSGGFIPLGLAEVKISFFSGKTLHIKNRVVRIFQQNKKDSVAISHPDDQYLFYVEKDSVGTARYVVVFDSIPTKVTLESTGLWGHHISRNLYLEYPDKIIYFYQKKAVAMFRNGEVRIQDLSFVPMFAIKSVEKGVWLGAYKNGVMYFPDEEFDQKPTIHILKKQFVTSLMYDQNNKGWVTTSYGGIFNVQSLNITNYFKPGSHPENFITKIVELEPSTYIFFARNNKVFLSRHFSLPMEELIIDELDDHIVYQAQLHGNFVFAATNKGILEIPINYFLNADHPKKGIKEYRFVSVKDFMFKDSILWIASSRGLFYETEFLSSRKFEPKNALNKRTRVIKLGDFPNSKTDSLYSSLLYQDIENLNQIRYRITASGSLDIYTRGFNKHENGIANNDIIVREKDKYIFLATKGDGLHIITDNPLLVLNTDDGLLSNTINVLKMPFDTILIAGTDKGLNIIKLSEDKYPKIIMSKFITTKDGLKGNEIHDIACFKNHALITTNNGISLIDIFKVVKRGDTFPILITNFIVNGDNKPIDKTKTQELKHDENNLQIEFDAIDFHDKIGMDYYYRLLGADKDDWVKIKKAGVVYPQLQDGTYIFQVKATNSYGYSSKNTASISFHIQQVFYNTILFKLILTILFFSIISGYLYLLYLRKTDKLRNKNIFDDYQQKSLMRVMNPHFIFNALNSVNAFIVTNRKKDATLYVSQIASLIRQIFNSATNNTITINDEMDFLNAYLKLEQRRLKDSFLYIIKADDDIKSIFIPSFMIQVFVENSVWHGLPLKKEKGALISVIFIKQEKYVLCEITDNGIGRKEASEIKKEKSTKREKHGIDVIKQRIDLINKRYKTEKISLRIEDRIDTNLGNALGTVVKIRFPKT